MGWNQRLEIDCNGETNTQLGALISVSHFIMICLIFLQFYRGLLGI